MVKSKSNFRKEKVKEVKKVIDGFSLENAGSYTSCNMRARSFEAWTRQAREVTDPDMARNVFYYGFQPLFDALVEDRISYALRERALEAYDQIVERNTQYLAGYYQNTPDVKLLHRAADETEEAFRGINDAGFYLKSRNLDSNEIYPADVLMFLNKFLDVSMDGAMSLPDTVVGCACGSSEIAMALGGVLEIPIHFIRKSKRRGDYGPRIIAEREDVLRSQVKDKAVVCIEDYLCTGGSLREVMKKVRGYGPASLRGAAIRHFASDFRESREIKLERRDKRFNVYSI